MAAVMQHGRTGEWIETLTARSISSLPGHSSSCIVGTAWAPDEQTICEWPIDYEGESVIIDPKYMYVEVPYPFLFLGHRLLAMKGHDDTIEFYYLPG